PAPSTDSILPNRTLVEFGPNVALPFGEKGKAALTYEFLTNWSDQYIFTNVNAGFGTGIDNVIESAWATKAKDDGSYDVVLRGWAEGNSGETLEERHVAVVVNNKSPCVGNTDAICNKVGSQIEMTLRFSESIRRDSLTVTYGTSRA